MILLRKIWILRIDISITRILAAPGAPLCGSSDLDPGRIIFTMTSPTAHVGPLPRAGAASFRSLRSLPLYRIDRGASNSTESVLPPNIELMLVHRSSSKYMKTALLLLAKTIIRICFKH